MIDTRFILKIFEGLSIQRWNDLVRPFDIVEMDKAAEKMVAAYIIGKYEENAGRKINWEWMIYSSLFYLLKKNLAFRHKIASPADDTGALSR